MSEALYRKYRPQIFEDVVGQTHIERTLKNAIESGKVSHAYLFCGPRGTGKTTTARLLAKALLCESGPTPSPDGTCEQCQAIADGTHPDVNEMDAASRTGVENVREEIIGRVQYAPIRGRYKIYIIDEVHMLSTAAFNALLKTLEEPPDHVVFILCTTDPQKVPETIHSRCQRFDFHRLSNEEIVSRLGAVCVSEGVQFEGDALDLIAHRAQGGMRDALTTLEQLIAFGNGSVTTEVACNVLGSLDVDDMTTIVNAIAARDAATCFTWLSEYIETGADLAQFTRDLATYVRDLYVLELTDGAVGVNAPASSRHAMADEAKKFGPDRLAYILRVLGDLSTELRSSTNARLSFEIALTRMVRPESDLTLESLAVRIEALEAAAATAPVSGKASAAQAHINTAQTSTALVSASEPAPLTSDVAEAKETPTSSMPQEHKPQTQPSWPTPSASVPRASAGYKPIAQQEPPSSPAIDATTAATNTASDSMRAKLMNPAALQRGWKAALSELKRQRAVYAALMQVARIVAEPDGSGIVIEFPKESHFAFSAAQKPDVVAALSAVLEAAFEGAVPLRFAQGDGIAAGTHPPVPSAAASAPAEYEQTSPHATASMMPADRGAQQNHETKRAEHDQAHPHATPADAAAPLTSKNEPIPKASSSQGVDVGVTGPAPVDPYSLGKKFGFDAMAAPAKQSDTSVPAKGWPGAAPKENPDGAVSPNPSPATTNQERVDAADASFAHPKPSSGDSMEIEDIFSTFGVSMKDVQEED